MEPEHTFVEQPVSTLNNLHTVTPLSKYLAMVLFVVLPFLGGWIGYNLAPETVTQVERFSEIENAVNSKYLTVSPVADTSSMTFTFETNYEYPDTYAGGRLLTINFGDDRETLIERKIQHTYASSGSYEVILEGCNPKVDLFCEMIELDSLQIEVTPGSVSKSSVVTLTETSDTLATTTIDMVSYQIRSSQDKVELLRGLEIMQTIPWDTYFRSVFTDDESLLITNWDINFDGYLDLGILSDVGYGGVNLFYHFYTFDPATYALIKINDFDTFEPDISNLVNPSLDIEARIITTEMKSGPDWIRKQYIFRDGTYVSEDALIAKYGVQNDSESCLVDSDCVLIQPDCEDCSFDAINLSQLDTFRVNKRNHCEANPPAIQCDIVFNGSVKCISNQCQIIQ